MAKSKYFNGLELAESYLKHKQYMKQLIADAKNGKVSMWSETARNHIASLLYRIFSGDVVDDERVSEYIRDLNRLYKNVAADKHNSIWEAFEVAFLIAKQKGISGWPVVNESTTKIINAMCRYPSYGHCPNGLPVFVTVFPQLADEYFKRMLEQDNTVLYFDFIWTFDGRLADSDLLGLWINDEESLIHITRRMSNSLGSELQNIINRIDIKSVSPSALAEWVDLLPPGSMENLLNGDLPHAFSNDDLLESILCSSRVTPVLQQRIIESFLGRKRVSGKRDLVLHVCYAIPAQLDSMTLCQTVIFLDERIVNCEAINGLPTEQEFQTRAIDLLLRGDEVSKKLYEAAHESRLKIESRQQNGGVDYSTVLEALRKKIILMENSKWRGLVEQLLPFGGDPKISVNLPETMCWMFHYANTSGAEALDKENRFMVFGKPLKEQVAKNIVGVLDKTGFSSQ